MPESIEPSSFVSHRARISGEFDSRIDSQSSKFQRRPQSNICKAKLYRVVQFKIISFGGKTCGKIPWKVNPMGKSKPLLKMNSVIEISQKFPKMIS